MIIDYNWYKYVIMYGYYNYIICYNYIIIIIGQNVAALMQYVSLYLIMEYFFHVYMLACIFVFNNILYLLSIIHIFPLTVMSLIASRIMFTYELHFVLQKNEDCKQY